MTDSGLHREHGVGWERVGFEPGGFGAPGSVLSQSCTLKTQVGGPVESLEAGRPFWGDCGGPAEKYQRVGQQ